MEFLDLLQLVAKYTKRLFGELLNQYFSLDFQTSSAFIQALK
jgi:hypothetical protein